MIQTARSDIYVVMLGIALGAIVLSCIFLSMVMNRYSWKTKPNASLTPPAGAQVVLAGISSQSSTVHL